MKLTRYILCWQRIILHEKHFKISTHAQNYIVANVFSVRVICNNTWNFGAITTFVWLLIKLRRSITCGIYPDLTSGSRDIIFSSNFYFDKSPLSQKVSHLLKNQRYALMKNKLCRLEDNVRGSVKRTICRS